MIHDKKITIRHFLFCSLLGMALRWQETSHIAHTGWPSQRKKLAVRLLLLYHGPAATKEGASRATKRQHATNKCEYPFHTYQTLLYCTSTSSSQRMSVWN